MPFPTRREKIKSMLNPLTLLMKRRRGCCGGGSQAAGEEAFIHWTFSAYAVDLHYLQCPVVLQFPREMLNNMNCLISSDWCPQRVDGRGRPCLLSPSSVRFLSHSWSLRYWPESDRKDSWLSTRASSICCGSWLQGNVGGHFLWKCFQGTKTPTLCSLEHRFPTWALS